MKKLLIFIFCPLFAFAQSEAIDVQIILDPSNQDSLYCTLLQIQGQNGADFIGNSSVLLTYDDNVLLFDGSSTLGQAVGSYQALNFDENDGSDPNNPLDSDCLVENGGFGVSPYGNHGYDGLTPGSILTTVVLLSPTVVEDLVFACPNISHNWTSISQICFEVLNPNGDPNVQIVGTENGFPENTLGSNFNSDTNNPANKYNNGEFTDLNIPFNALSQGDLYFDASSSFTPYPCTDNMGTAFFECIAYHPDNLELPNVYLVPNFNTADTIYPSSYSYYEDPDFPNLNVYEFTIYESPASLIPNFSSQNAYTVHFADLPEYDNYEISAYTDYSSDYPEIQGITLENTPINTPLLNQSLSLYYSPFLDDVTITPVDVPNHSFENGTIVYDETDQTFDYYPSYNFEGIDYFYLWAEVNHNDSYTFQELFKASISIGSPVPDPADYGTYQATDIAYNAETGVLDVEWSFVLNPNESYLISVNGSNFNNFQTTDGVFTYGDVFFADSYYNSYLGDNTISFAPYLINIENENDPTESYTFNISEVPFESNRTECSPGLIVDTIAANAYTTTISFTGGSAPYSWQPDLWRPCGTQEWNVNGTYDSLSQEFTSSPTPLEIEVSSDGWGYCFEFAQYYGTGIYPYWETASSSYFNLQETPFTAKVFLEGPYAENETMSTNLGILLPTTHPFGEAPYYYSGSESIAALSESDLENIVDWVLVEARVGVPNNSEQKTQIMGTKAGILLSDGSIVSTDLNSPLTFNAIFGQEYHFCIRQRNHLDVLTSAGIIDLDFNYDLTLSDETAFGTLQLKQMSDGKFAMYAGDFNSEGVIQTTDYDLWFELPAALNVYEPTDANLDGVIQVTDYDIWFGNKAKIGTPEVRLD